MLAGCSLRLRVLRKLQREGPQCVSLTSTNVFTHAGARARQVAANRFGTFGSSWPGPNWTGQFPDPQHGHRDLAFHGVRPHALAPLRHHLNCRCTATGPLLTCFSLLACSLACRRFVSCWAVRWAPLRHSQVAQLKACELYVSGLFVNAWAADCVKRSLTYHASRYYCIAAGAKAKWRTDHLFVKSRLVAGFVDASFSFCCMSI